MIKGSTHPKTLPWQSAVLKSCSQSCYLPVGMLGCKGFSLQLAVVKCPGAAVHALACTPSTSPLRESVPVCRSGILSPHNKENDSNDTAYHNIEHVWALRVYGVTCLPPATAGEQGRPRLPHVIPHNAFLLPSKTYAAARDAWPPPRSTLVQYPATNHRPEGCSPPFQNSTARFTECLTVSCVVCNADGRAASFVR